MFGMVVLDVSIGLIFFYLLFSLIGSAVAESIELVLKARARTLEEGIRSILFDPQGKQMAARFYAHPLIKSLRREPGDLPLPFQIFRSVGKGWEKLSARLKKAPSVGISRFELPSYIPSELFVAALMDTIARPGAAGAASAAEGLDLKKLQASIEALTKADDTRELGRALAALLPAETPQELAVYRTRLEGWFDSSMDRVSGWYKQRTQWVLFLIGLVTAALMNADSIQIAQVLSRDRAIREAVVAMAQQHVKERQASAPAAPAAPGTATPTDPVKQLQAELDEVSQSVSNVEALGLPLGWSETERKKLDAATGRHWWLLIALKALGLLATAVAVALGAPFWFDLLNKFMVVRSTVKPQEKSRKEGSKDG